MTSHLSAVRIRGPQGNHITGLIFGILFTLLPLAFGCIALFDDDFMAAIYSDPLILVWLTPFFFVCEFIGVVSLIGSIKHLLYPAYIAIDASSQYVTLRFWAGETTYDERYEFRDISSFELVDSTVANELSLLLWEEMSIKHNWFDSWWNKLLRRALFWMKNQERVLSQQNRRGERTDSSPISGKATFHLKVNLQNNTSRVLKDLYWSDKAEAEKKVNALSGILNCRAVDFILSYQ